MASVRQLLGTSSVAAVARGVAATTNVLGQLQALASAALAVNFAGAASAGYGAVLAQLVAARSVVAELADVLDALSLRQQQQQQQLASPPSDEEAAALTARASAALGASTSLGSLVDPDTASAAVAHLLTVADWGVALDAAVGALARALNVDRSVAVASMAKSCGGADMLFEAIEPLVSQALGAVGLTSEDFQKLRIVVAAMRDANRSVADFARTADVARLVAAIDASAGAPPGRIGRRVRGAAAPRGGAASDAGRVGVAGRPGGG
jgi:hypothetical protein